jgi:hypothetical protein
MRRLAIVFAILAVVSTVEHVVLAGKLTGCEKPIRAPGRMRRAMIGMRAMIGRKEWRAFLIGPIRLLERTTSRALDAGPWLGQGN